MNDDFAQFVAFYDRCGPDAIGHGAVAIAIAGHESELIERFIAGMCNASERRQVVQFLRSHPHLIIQIARRVRMNRKPFEVAISSN